VEPKTKLTVEGQELPQSDLNAIAEVAAYADDRVLWELLRLVPDPSGRAVLPFGLRNGQPLTGLTSAAMVQGGTSDRKVKVMPFRAIVRPTAFAGQIELLRALRSAYCVGTSTAWQSVTVNTNSDPSNARWTLLYAAVTPDLGTAPVSRFVKDPTTAVVTSEDISVSLTTQVALGTVDGTTSATPTKPAIPADAGGTFYIALAYLWVPASFGASSAVQDGYIYEVMPAAAVAAATGAASFAPANHQYKVGGTVDSRQGGDATTRRAQAYVPPTMLGVEERLVALELVATVGNPHASHNDGDVVDDSTDWRGRLFQWTAWVGPSASGNLATSTPSHAGSPLANLFPTAVGGSSYRGVGFTDGGGQSMVDDTGGLNSGSNPDNPALAIVDGNGVACFLAQSRVTNLGGAGAGVVLYVRQGDGALVLRKNAGVTHGSIVIWFRATGPYSLFAP